MLSNIWSLIDNKLFQHSVSTIMMSIHSTRIQFVTSQALQIQNPIQWTLDPNKTEPETPTVLHASAMSWDTFCHPLLSCWHCTGWDTHYSPILWCGGPEADGRVGGPGPAKQLSGGVASLVTRPGSPSRDGSIFTPSASPEPRHHEVIFHYTSCSSLWLTFWKYKCIFTL